ncbi:MAG: hypothetical protein SGCHY_005197, partial [Lobulomycetales sp.]
HIIEYTGENRGLFLHGINENSISLHTWPSDRVKSTAALFGFHPVHHISFDSIPALRQFSEKCAETGSYNDLPIEGWVVRTTTTTDSPHFFKIKYDEPYLMYREWREITKRLLKTGSPGRIRYPRSHAYADYVRSIMASGDVHGQLTQIPLNRGIHRLRRAFLTSPTAPPPSSALLIIPVGLPCTGKTRLGRILAHLSIATHIEHDADPPISARKRTPRFLKSLHTATSHGAAVYADHSCHRAQMRRETASAAPSASRIIVVCFPHDLTDRASLVRRILHTVQLRYTPPRLTRRKRYPVHASAVGTRVASLVYAYEPWDAGVERGGLPVPVDTVDVPADADMRSIVEMVVRACRVEGVSRGQVDEAVRVCDEVYQREQDAPAPAPAPAAAVTPAAVGKGVKRVRYICVLLDAVSCDWLDECIRRVFGAAELAFYWSLKSPVGGLHVTLALNPDIVDAGKRNADLFARYCGDLGIRSTDGGLNSAGHGPGEHVGGVESKAEESIGSPDATVNVEESKAEKSIGSPDATLQVGESKLGEGKRIGSDDEIMEDQSKVEESKLGEGKRIGSDEDQSRLANHEKVADAVTEKVVVMRALELVWNDRVMCVTIDCAMESLNEQMHCTVRLAEVAKAKESNDVLKDSNSKRVAFSEPVELTGKLKAFYFSK